MESYQSLGENINFYKLQKGPNTKNRSSQSRIEWDMQKTTSKTCTIQGGEKSRPDWTSNAVKG